MGDFSATGGDYEGTLADKVTVKVVVEGVVLEAERTVLDALGGGCSIPIGVHCSPIREDSETIAWRLHAQVLAPDGERMICLSTEVPVGIAAHTLGLQAAADLKSRGALELLSVDLPA